MYWIGKNQQNLRGEKFIKRKKRKISNIVRHEICWITTYKRIVQRGLYLLVIKLIKQR